MKKKTKSFILISICTLVLALLVHMSLFTKNIITADVLLNNFYYKGYSWEISLGRFGLFFIGLLKGYNSIPIIDLIPSFILLCFINYYLIKLFELDGSINKILTILLVIISPIISVTLVFHYCSIGYLIALLCGILSTYIFYKSENKIIKYLIPIVLIVISLSMYQAYLSLIVTVFVLYNIKLLLNKKFKLKESLKYLLVLITGIIIYFILMKLSLIVFHINMSDYSNADKVGLSLILDIPSKFISSYKLFFEFIFKDTIIKNSYFHTYIYYILLFIMMVIAIVRSIIKKKIKLFNIILVTILILLLPVFLNSVIFVVNEVKLQLLMSASYITIPIFIVSLDYNKICKIILVIILGLLLRVYYVQIEASYKSLDNTFNSYKLIINKAIKKSDNHKYMFIGSIDTTTNINKLNYGYVSDLGIFWDEYNLKKIAFCKYTKYYLNKEVEFVDMDTYNNLVNNEYNSIINYTDDVVIINFDKLR